MLINSSNVRSKNGLSRTQWTSFYLDGETKAPGRDTEIKTSATAFRAASEQVTFWLEPLKEEAEITGPAAATVICRILDDGCRYLRDVARVRAERS